MKMRSVSVDKCYMLHHCDYLPMALGGIVLRDTSLANHLCVKLWYNLLAFAYRVAAVEMAR